jgi:putative transposase
MSCLFLLWEKTGKNGTDLFFIDEYLLACCRCVELNPMHAGIVAGPADYRWSSYRAKIGIRSESRLDADPCSLRLDILDKKRLLFKL